MDLICIVCILILGVFGDGSRIAVMLSVCLLIWMFMNLDFMDKYWSTCVIDEYNLCECSDFMWCR